MSDDNNRSLVPSQAGVPDFGEETFEPQSFIPRTQLERLIATVRDFDSQFPLHLQQLMDLPYPSELKEQLKLAYSSEAQKLDRYMNQDMECLGMVIWEVPPYMKHVPKGEPSVQMPGFFQLRILTSVEDQDHNWLVLRSSSVDITASAFFIMQDHGAWLFKKPITFRFFKGNGGAHHMVKAGESLKELKDFIRKGMGQ